ncbi:MAG TPA: glycosyltransferase family 2 protein [Acetobacteraceae bacterium]|nr:glycosyltransferase family 2 protein [Acetobacteraceae bacterium]
MNEAVVTDPVREAAQCIWTGKTAAIADLPRIDPTTWEGAVQTDLIAFGAHASLTAPAEAAAPNPRVAVVMMAKDEADIIGRNLGWLYFIGVRRFVIADNASTDATAETIRAFRARARDAELYLVDDPVVRHIQAEKTTGLTRFAISAWPDLAWIIPADSDEFLIPMAGLARLDAVDPAIDALTIPKVIHFRHRVAPAEHDTVMGRMGYRSPLFCVPPKVVLRADLRLTITQGNHHVVRLDGVRPRYSGGLSFGFCYREFPNRSADHYLRKIRNGGRAILAANAALGRGVGGDHWLAAYERLQAVGEDEFRREFERDWVIGPRPGYIIDPFEGAPAGMPMTAKPRPATEAHVVAV